MNSAPRAEVGHVTLRVATLIPLTLGVVGLMLLTNGSLYGAQLDFNAASQLDEFNQRDEAQWYPIDWASSGGINNSGALVPSRAHDATYKGETFDLRAPASRVIVSTFFKTTQYSLPGPSQSFSFGEVYLSRNDTGWFGAAATLNVSQHPTAILLVGSIGLGGGTVGAFTPSFPSDVVQPQRWYELRVAFENINNTHLGWDIELNDYGADGLAYLGTVIASQHQTANTLGFLGEATLHAGFAATPAGVAAVDNFSAVAVPEPAGCTLLLGAAAWCGATRRRRW
jgi:hypothetical protein